MLVSWCWCWDSNPDCADFKSAASAGWATPARWAASSVSRPGPGRARLALLPQNVEERRMQHAVRGHDLVVAETERRPVEAGDPAARLLDHELAGHHVPGVEALLP